VLVILAAETSKAPFYVSGGLLAAYAILLAGLGITRHATFPPSEGAARGIIAVALLLVVASMATAVLTA